MTGVPDFLVSWARCAGPRAVLAKARDRLERGRLGVRAKIDVPLSPAERTDVGKMLDAAWAQSGDPVRVRDLRRGLEEHGATLEELLTEMGGPLRDLPGETRRSQEAASAAQRDAISELRRLLGVPVPAGLEHSVTEALTRWVLRGAPDGNQAAEVGHVVRGLPEDGVEQLAVLAARLFSDAHALDRTRSLGRAVARFLAIRAAVASVGEGEVTDSDTAYGPVLGFLDPVATPEGWREVWASANVSCDEVSSQVLVLNLPLTGDAPAVALCSAAPGEPTWLTLRSLRGVFALPGVADVFVCENPSVVQAAAAEFGAGTRPVICTFGRPTIAVWELLRGIAPDARLHVRADGDVTGWSIVRGILDAFPDAVPWRMPEGSSEYEEELLPDLLDDLRNADFSRPASG